MTMRASTSREVPTGVEDAFGQPVTAPQVLLASHPCRWQVRTERFIADGEKVVALAQHFILFPLGTDVKELDTVTAITDRRGRSLKDTRLRVVVVIRREDHSETAVEEYA